MSKLLRLLVVEDSEDDTLLLVSELRRGGYNPEWQRVETAEAMNAALDQKMWDIIIADYSMPQFNGIEALNIMKEHELDLPFILVSGTIGEETAVEAMKAGAHDYVMKDRLKRLAPVVERELKEAKIRKQRKIAEEALWKSEEKFRVLFEQLPIGVSLLDQNRKMIYVNPALEKILDISRDDLHRDKYQNRRYIRPDGTPMPPEEYASVRAFREKRLVRDVETGVITESGKTVWTSVSAAPFPIADKGVVIATVDISDRKRAEEALKASLREKEVLIREIHHRVKNNMQIISSLLNLQSRQVQDETILEVFRECQNRIRTMAFVHEKLFRSKDLSKINFSEYIEDLVVHLFQTFQINSGRIQFKPELENIYLDINTANPVALLVNELVSNALKHAFPGGRKGEIQVHFASLENKKIKLLIKDNGIGFPKGLDFRKAETLGLQIVMSLVGQIEGTIDLDCQKGTEFKIVFSELKYKPIS
jgi:two-component system response regulator